MTESEKYLVIGKIVTGGGTLGMFGFILTINLEEHIPSNWRATGLACFALTCLVGVMVTIGGAILKNLEGRLIYVHGRPGREMPADKKRSRRPWQQPTDTADLHEEIQMYLNRHQVRDDDE